jgi:hypothetical protein
MERSTSAATRDDPDRRTSGAFCGIDLLLCEAMPGPEYRGLMRLRVLALRGAQEHGELVFLGD